MVQYEKIKKQDFALPKAQSPVKKTYDRFDNTHDIALEGWIRSLRLRDRDTEEHSRRAARLAVELACAFHIPEQQWLHYWRGGLLHDIGKISIPDTILFKTGALTEEERIIMKSHPVLGYECLKTIAYLLPCLAIPYHHHECWDGTGYPSGLQGTEIPLEARIFAIADVWDALRSDRPYRPRWSEKKARNYIQERAGAHFDPQLVNTFLQLPASVLVI